ncbi:Phosphatidylinositolglycan class N-domain-containing protein [Crepidotus variabilis]|uniref:GPI ethanolamine phosphate transferase 1 n=1 Tax=Crepidotus variabilis TaxID=179855 RepID=A0A9P6EFZ8_9AGAR|nr:Phosphatidylinositolglycan class N-domain-containing protein [Crepidotus variabilis]
MAVTSKTRLNGQTALPKSHYNVGKLLFIGLIFHLAYILSVFDCYFTSPVVHGMNRYGATEGGQRALAKRLVLIVGDGLRADLLFNVNAFPSIENSTAITAPYLRSIAEHRGAFGVSHTRVPTESRPGHVAIIGGMYEDVSAVTKGWKTNPVDFDSVFNQSSSTYSFGSPDILPMFATGATPGKVKQWSYDEHEEDFTKDATALDVWVLDQLKTLLKNSTTDSFLSQEVRGDKVVFFLHLIGLDSTGHSYRPHSKEYMNNIRVVDDIVRETESLFRSFYGDEDTAFIFTADHGMSEIGNHGDGHPDNTRTPIIAWGSGVRGPEPDSSPSSHDEYSMPWKLGSLFRRDMEQADVAALMAALIGIDWPVNSVGVLADVDPTKPGYLLANDEKKGEAALVNAKVVLEQYRVKHDLKKAHTMLYKPFGPLADLSTTDDSPYVIDIQNLLLANKWSAAREASAILIDQSLNGLHYLQTYDRFLIQALVSFAYLGWVAYASLYVLRPKDHWPKDSSAYRNVIGSLCLFVALGLWTSFYIQKSPTTFYIYAGFPCYFWYHFLAQMLPVAPDVASLKLSVGRYIRIAATLAMAVAALIGMVIGYTHRSVWGCGFVLMGLAWPLTWQSRQIYENKRLLGLWALSCLSTAIFPLLSVNKTESLTTIMVGGGIMLMAGVILSRKTSSQLRMLYTIQSALILATLIITWSSVNNLQAKQGLPLFYQMAGWAALVIGSIVPFVDHSTGHTKASKIASYFLGFGPCFIILSISVEGLFFISYTTTLLTWVKVETLVRSEQIVAAHLKQSKKDLVERKEYRFQLDDLRIALFFLFMTQVGFFGTGNVASIASFYLAPVYRLIPIFSPFYMSALLLFKIIAPYVILAVIFAELNDSLDLPPFSLLLVSLSLTDGMTLTFFFLVQDTGSWLEIGQSITFFCIASLLLLWSAGICVAGEYLMADATTPKNS